MANNNYTHKNLQKQRTPLMFTLVKKTMLFSLAIFLTSLVALSTITYLSLTQAAGYQNQIMQQSVGKQIAKLNAANILSYNLIALNLSLQDLVSDGGIEGAIIYNEQGTMLAKAGLVEEGDTNNFTIRSNDNIIGKLHINLAPLNLQPSIATLYEIIWPIALILGIISLLIGYWFGRRLVAPMRTLDDAQNQLLDYQRAPHLDEERLDEWGAINIGFNLIHQKQLIHAKSEMQLAFDDILETSIPITGKSPAQLKHYSDIKSLANELSADHDATNSHDDTLDDPLFNQSQHTPSARTVPILTMEDLQNNRHETLVDSAQTDRNGELNSQQDTPATLENTPPSADVEDQLRAMQDVPQVSLMYINFNTLDQGPIAAEEKLRLLEEYQNLVTKVCEIYQGDVQIQPNKDVLVAFDRPEEHMTHCVNALCAAQFFTGLYNAFNTQLIAKQRPTLNVQVVVHTGTLEDSVSIAQHAIELCQDANTNGTIISSQVAYHPDLQKRILEKDYCLLLTNSAFGLSRLSREYQDLIDKQVEYFADFL